MKRPVKNGFGLSWPWELEILVVAFALAVVILPPLLPTVRQAAVPEMALVDQAKAEALAALNALTVGRTDAVWVVGVLVLYVLHIVLGIRAHRLISTPLLHLLSPMLFAGLLFGRLTQRVPHLDTSAPVVEVTFLSVLLTAAVMAALVLLVARVRMARCLFAFRDAEFAMSRPAVYDRTFWTLAPFVHPVIYPPAQYHAFKQAVVIEGWLYLSVIPMERLVSAERVQRQANIPSGTFFATSRNTLVRLKVKDLDGPVFISPKDADRFARYVAEQITECRRKTPTSHGLAKAA